MSNDIKTFRVAITYLAGYVFLASSIGLLYLQSPANEIFKYVVSFLMGLFGIYLLLAYYISRVSLYTEKIVYYNIIGRKSVILWSDITSVLLYYSYGKSRVHEKMFLNTGNKKLTLGNRFDNFQSMKTIIREKCPAAFLRGKVESGGTQTLKTINGAIAVFCLIPLGIIIGAVLIVNYSLLDLQTAALCLVGSVSFTFTGLVQLLLWLFSRVHINAQSITHINMFGVKKQLMWPEITSATFNSTDIRSPGVRLSGGGKTIKLNRNYLRFEGVEDIIRKYSLGR